MEPIAVRSHWQLFLDDYVLAHTTGLSRVVHHPRPRGVVIPADRPWETVGLGLQLVERRQDGTFVAYYLAMWWDGSMASREKDRAHHVVTAGALATSEDGLHWRKPDLGLMDAPAAVDWSAAPFPNPTGTTRANNLGVPFNFLFDLGQHGNVADPQKRYAMRLSPQGAFEVGSNWRFEPRGHFAAQIPDFVNDVNWRGKLVDSGGCFDPRRHILHFWDELHAEWVALEQGVSPHWLPSREIGRFGSRDLVHWTGTSVLYPDTLDPHAPDCFDEPMSMTPYCADGVVYGQLSWFHSDRSHPDGGPNLNTSPEHPHRWPWCRKGTNEMRITVSRDGGYTWDRTSSRQAWVPHGTEEDSYDRLVIGAQPPVRVGDEDWFFLGVINGDHLGIRNDPGQTAYYHDRMPRHQVALYVQKHHRYVSLTAANQRRVLVTRPLRCPGGRLELNADASRGQIRVAVASGEPLLLYDGTTPTWAPHLADRQVLPGFAFDDAQPVFANATAHTVGWGAGQSLDALEGQPVVLLFEMVNADLYGFRFAEATGT